MASVEIKNPFETFRDTDGSPLDAGYIYIGTANLEPVSNPISVFWDEAMTIPAAQPIRTLAGLPSRGGTPSGIFVGSNYSILIRDKHQRMVYSDPSVLDIALDLASTVTGKGDALIAVLQPFAGAVARTQHDKNKEYISVLDADDVDPTGVTGSSVGIQAALDSGYGTVFVPDGTYLIDQDLEFGDDFTLVFSSKAVFKAGADNLTFFKTSRAFRSSIINAHLDGNNHAAVTGFDLTNFRLGATLDHPYMTNMTNGMIVRSGCFGAAILSPTTFDGVPNPLYAVGAVSQLVIDNPAFDNHFGGSVTNPADTGVGIKVDRHDGTFQTLGVRIIGGYIQGFVNGIIDRAINTEIEGTYFEHCSDADIYLNGDLTPVSSRAAMIRNTRHSASVGAVAIKGRDWDGLIVDNPQMGSGARSTGLFDFDATCTNCTAIVPGSIHAWNTPLGVTTGIGICGRSIAWTVTDASSDALAFTQNVAGIYTRNGNVVTAFGDITFPATSGVQLVQIALPIPARAGSIISGSIGQQTYGSAIFIEGVPTFFRLRTVANAALQNVNMSTKRLQFSITYIAA